MTHDRLAPVAALDWTAVTVALITLAGVVFGGLVAVYNTRLLRTPSKKPIGEQVESAHHVAISNAHRVQLLARMLGVDVDELERQVREEAAVDADTSG